MTAPWPNPVLAYEDVAVAFLTHAGFLAGTGDPGSDAIELARRGYVQVIPLDLGGGTLDRSPYTWVTSAYRLDCYAANMPGGKAPARNVGPAARTATIPLPKRAAQLGQQVAYAAGAACLDGPILLDLPFDGGRCKVRAAEAGGVTPIPAADPAMRRTSLTYRLTWSNLS